MASDMKKPLGITILRKREVPRILWPMDISEMYGVGRKTAEKLKTLEIEKIGDLAAADEYALKRLLGINGPRLKRRANGIDTGEVNPDRIYEFKSVGNSSTLPHDSTDEKELFGLIDKLSISVSDRLKRKEVMAKKSFHHDPLCGLDEHNKKQDPSESDRFKRRNCEGIESPFQAKIGTEALSGFWA